MVFAGSPAGRDHRSVIIVLAAAVLLASVLFSPRPAVAGDALAFAGLAAEYKKTIRPLLGKYCLGCHSTKKKVGELDLEQFGTLVEVRKGTRSWLKMVEMLTNGEMPPKKSAQPSAIQRQLMVSWGERYLDAEALSRAGDPGPVPLRRLNNAQYTYTIRDLTGVRLDPVREFPSEGAAGEGFTNASNALAMSPALLRKYLDAGQQVARHAMLVSEGIRFSVGSRRRDWTDQILSEIRDLYGQFTTTVKLHSHYNLPKMSHLGNAGQKGELQGWRPTLDKPNIPRPPEGIPQNIADHMKLMCDIVVLAFQTDMTRVCTLKLNNDHSYLQFPHLGGEVGHHELSHSDRGKQSPDWLKVNHFFMEQYAYIARKLDAIQEGERTALDNSMLMMCSSMMSGIHDATKLPVVVLGRGGGQLETGRVLSYHGKPNRKMCSLYLSLMEKCGVRLKAFGDSTAKLDEV